MFAIYRYVDLKDEIIKYIGIVWGEKQTLFDRIYAHECQGQFWGYNWHVDFIELTSRTECECLEAHFITLYRTDKYLNIAKTGWGLCSFVPKNLEWQPYYEKEYTYSPKENETAILYSPLAQRPKVCKSKKKYKSTIEMINSIKNPYRKKK